MKSEGIERLLAPVLAEHRLDLDALEVVPAGKRSLLRVVVDGDGPDGTGPLLDDIASATKAISAALDESDVTGSGPYTLEVTSRGVSRPLTLPRHWRRNVGRLVRVTTTDHAQVTGRISASDDDQVRLTGETDPIELAYSSITKALIQVELNRPDRTEDHYDQDEHDHDDHDHEEADHDHQDEED